MAVQFFSHMKYFNILGCIEKKREKKVIAYEINPFI